MGRIQAGENKMTLPEALDKYDKIYRNNVGEPSNFLIELVKELKKDLPYIEKKDKAKFKIIIKKMSILGFKEVEEDKK